MNIYPETYLLQIFCYASITCPNNLVAVNSTCQCISPLVLAGNYCIATVGCLNATINSTGGITCTSCGYGLEL